MNSKSPARIQLNSLSSKNMTPAYKASGLDLNSPMKSTSSRATAATSKNSGSSSPVQNFSADSLLSLKNKTKQTQQVTTEPLNLQVLSQLGEPDPTAISKHDVLSAMAFDLTGNILSVGDKGGRVICFQLGKNERGQLDYEYLTEFQAHASTFDVLSSQQISETVTGLQWINQSQSQQPAVLASNARQIKLFRLVSNKEQKCESAKKKLARGKGLQIPRIKTMSESKEGKHVTTFKTGKEQSLHSLSLSPDYENFLATDKSHVWLWNLERSGHNPVYNLIDYNRDKTCDDDE